MEFRAGNQIRKQVRDDKMKHIYDLWEDSTENTTKLTHFIPLKGSADSAVLVLPGGAYSGHADYEGEGYAQMFNTFGMHAFVLQYRVAPFRFPAPLSDARRAIRFIRKNAEKFGIKKDKILVIGSSAGGHLAALLCTYNGEIAANNDEIDKEDFLPNAQILCYPVISTEQGVMHTGSYQNLLGNDYDKRERFAPDKLVSERTPKAFIWHTAEDGAVSVINSYRYAEALARRKIACELHVFPYGPHGMGVSPQDIHVAQWIELLRRWLRLNKFI